MIDDNIDTGFTVAAPQAGSTVFGELKAKVHHKLLETMDLVQARRMPLQQLHNECGRRVDVLLSEEKCPLSAVEKQQLIREVMDEVFGLGPLEIFLRDPTISDVLVNGPHSIYIERNGRLEPTDAQFRDEAMLMQVIQRIGASVGRRIDQSSPMLDARLSDGSRVNAIIPPLSLQGPVVSIRRFGAVPLDLTRLIEMQALTGEMANFLNACVRCKMNVMISGGTGTGKTTLLNVLSAWIPPAERVITIEDAAELKLQRKHVVRLETRPPNIEGKGEVTQRDLLRNALRMRPDRIIIGEVRGQEALDMLQAMNTGHEGSMSTVHANNARDAIRRVENMVSMAGLNFPVHAIRQQICSALNLMVQVGRTTGGRRRIVSISEITGMEGETVCMQDLFVFHQTGVSEDGQAQGQFCACGVRPKLLERLAAEGVEFPAEMFQKRVLDVLEPMALPA
jgi:pilus assembly protein CpaF